MSAYADMVERFGDGYVLEVAARTATHLRDVAQVAPNGKHRCLAVATRLERAVDAESARDAERDLGTAHTWLGRELPRSVGNMPGMPRFVGTDLDAAVDYASRLSETRSALPELPDLVEYLGPRP